MFWNVLIFFGKLVVGIVAAFLFTILAVLMNLPFGGGGRSQIAMGWLAIAASVLWALSPVFGWISRQGSRQKSGRAHESETGGGDEAREWLDTEKL